MTDRRKLRLGQLLDALWNCSGEGGCTRKMIAELLGLKKTPYLIQLINQAVADGWISEEIDTLSWPHRMIYRPTEQLAKWHADRVVA